MENEEIDSWYEDEKQKCMDEYLRDIELKKNYDEAEAKYNEKLNKLIDKYNKLMTESLKTNKGRSIQSLISALKARFLKER